ncbi:MAG: hypothetical protein MJY87_03860 [Fibrobacter sp.]|nr:hypothetical protein [Fibrobacter sp.]
MKVILCVLFLWGAAFAVDSPVVFVQPSSGNLDVSGAGGFLSTPARRSNPSIYVACFLARDVEEYSCSGGGEFRWKESRFAFFSSLHGLDSLYMQSYSEMDISYDLKFLLVGLGYGFSMEWIPGEDQWYRHRLKMGGTYIGDRTYWGVAVSGWLPGKNTGNWIVGGGVWVRDWGRAFLEWNDGSLLVGSSVKWKWLEVRTSYAFPDFGVSLALSVSLGGFSVDSHYGPASGKTGWIGLGLQKRIEKMTIL